MTPLSIKTTPGLAFLANVAFAHGMLHEGTGPVAQLLIVHAPPRRVGETAEWITANMRALSDCLCLGPVRDTPRYVGSRLSLRGETVELDYGDHWWSLRIPGTGPAWRRHVAGGGPVRLTLSVEPTPFDLPQEELSRRIENAVEAGTVRWGTTRARPRSRLNLRTSRPGV